MRNYFAAISIGALALALSAASCKCSKDEEVPAMPSAAPVATPSAPLEIQVPDDAAADAADDAADAAKKVGTGTYDPTHLLACCKALSQNAKSAPPAQAPFMLQAAAMCESAAKAGNSGGVLSALGRFGMGCK